MRTKIPPDLPSVVDRRGLDQELDEVLVLIVARELRRDAGTRETAPDDLAVGLQARVSGEPEGAGCRDREQVREEVTGLVHHLDAPLAVGDAHVHMEAEDQELTDHVLELLLEDLVALVLGHQLVLPV